MSMSSLVFMIVVILCALYGGLLVTTTIEYFKNQRYFFAGVIFMYLVFLIMSFAKFYFTI